MPKCCPSCKNNYCVTDNIFESKDVCEKLWILKTKYKILTWSDEFIWADNCPEYLKKLTR